MKILEACFLFYKLTMKEFQLSDEASINNFYDIVYIERLQENLSILKKAVDILHKWQITPVNFSFDLIYSEQQVIETAKELICVICECIGNTCETINQNFFSSMIESISEEEKENYLIRFMEKYLKAASIYPNKSDEERKAFLIYAFDIDEENVSDVLGRWENYTQRLIESRDAFIIAAVSWNMNKTDQGDKTVFVEEAGGKLVAAEIRGETDEKSEDTFEQLDTIEEKENDECNEFEIAEEINETMRDILNSDVFDAFYQIMEGDIQEVEVASSDEAHDEEEEKEEEKEEAEKKEEEPEIKRKEDDKQNNREDSEREIQSTPEMRAGNEKKESMPNHVNKKRVMEAGNKTYVQRVQDEFHEKCSGILQKWIDMLQKGEIVRSSDESELYDICWDLLLKGEFILAREIITAFHESSSKEYANFAIIDVIGSGIFMPVTDKDTQQYFLLYQPLLQFDQLEKWEQTAVTLASLPIAHCCFEARIDSLMLQSLPDIFREWADRLVELRKEITYIDRSVIENYRIYQVRKKKLENIHVKARQQFEAMQNANISYELANRILSALCGKEQYIGILWSIMNELDPKLLAVGTIDLKVRELYRKGRAYISEKKNTIKSVDEGLIQKIIEEGRKKCGFNKEVVGGPKQKMVQLIGEFLMSVNEWLELISNPCSYNSYDFSSTFIQQLSENYQKYRTELYREAEKREEKILAYIYKNTLAAMDYLIGIREDMPQGCKSYLKHIYRLCSVPNLYIKKNELGIYQCKCPNPIEHLSFLNKVINSDLCAAGNCLDRFVEADAFSGCAVIFDVIEQTQLNDLEKLRERYEQRVQKRLYELKCETVRMKKDLYQLSVYSGWLGNDYFTTLSKVAMLERMVGEEPDDLTMLCSSINESSDNVERLVERFCDILRSQVRGNCNEEQSRKLYALIEEKKYAAVIEWSAHLNISDTGIEVADFFKERYFNYDIYSRKEKSLLQEGGIKDLVNKLQTAILRGTYWEGFDFNRVPGGIANRRVELIRLWYQIKSKFKNINKISTDERSVIFDDLKQMLKALGWDVTDLKECEFCEDESGSYLQFDMHFKSTHSRERCPIPLFGSDSDGRIRMICLYGSANAPDKQYDLFENKSQQIPMIILFFGVMTHMRRMELYHIALKKQSTFLVVDDIIIATICECRESMLLRWLYTLAVPFSVQQLYTSALGVVHPEMFYGRVSAKAELGIGGKVCAVYGGRQLGKTALLKHIETEFHNPEIDHFVYYISLPTVAVEYPDAVLTKEMVNIIRKDILAGRRYENMAEVLEDISEWIRQKETRRLLLLLDEADEFLLADGKSGFRVTSSINRVMTSSNLRFKVVFAGLHNVYRSISSPNNPLAHYGKPISIGPLLDDELPDAINLIKQPFEIMGYRFESLDLIIWILAETNYYPSLIQLFCMRLHDYLHQPEMQKKHSYVLPVTICKEDIDFVLKDRTLKKSISERFMWTLDLDDRYKAIVLSIAFDAGNASRTDLINDFAKGYDLHWIQAEIEKWPNLFKEHCSSDELRGLCDELIQLGILRSVSTDRYTLRSVNILDMLGTQENILRKMYELESRHYDYNKMYNGTLYRSIFRDRKTGCKCYPLTNQQIHSALDTGGIKLIIGSHALGIDIVEKCLRELLALDMDFPSAYDLYQQKAYKLYVHVSKFPDAEKLGDNLSIHLVHWECAWETGDLKLCMHKLDALDEQKRPVVLLLCDEKKSWRLWENLSVGGVDIPVIRLAAWDMEAVQFWLNESSAPPLLKDDLIQIMERLCGWPAAMYQLWELITESGHEFDFNDTLLEQTVACLAKKSELLDFILKNSPAQRLTSILNIYAEYETDMTCEDIQYILKEADDASDLEHIAYEMAWLADMGFLNRQIQNNGTGEGNKKVKYSIDSLILELWKRRIAS